MMLDSDGKPDIAKLQPFIFTPETKRYYGIGAYIGTAYEIGKR
jgi:hypothetical protein